MCNAKIVNMCKNCQECTFSKLKPILDLLLLKYVYLHLHVFFFKIYIYINKLKYTKTTSVCE